MGLDIAFALNDGDFYTRPANGGRHAEYRASGAPAGWSSHRQDVWTTWSCDSPVPAQGWKVHVSARYERAQHVLDAVAAICFAEGVPFKHLATEQFFLYLHNKHAPRVQSGKFIACYPTDVESA